MFIDILRGILMLLVVMVHVDNCSFGPYFDLAINEQLSWVRMPLFFFISGFLSYSTGYTPSVFIRRLSNRVICQLYPTVILFAAFLKCFDIPLLAGIDNLYKQGFWFTYAVFVHFCILAVICLAMNKYMRSCRVSWLVPAVLAAAATCTLYEQSPVITHFHDSPLYLRLSLPLVAKMLPYFLIGATVKALYAGIDTHIITHRRGPAIVAVILTGTIAARYLSDSSLVGTCCSGMIACGIFLTAAIIASKTPRTDHPSARILAHVGRTTLPIYLLHFFIVDKLYFIIPADIREAVLSSDILPAILFPLLTVLIVASILAVHTALLRLRLGRLLFPPRVSLKKF
ncbi:MAG: acyltransferase [Bacteroides sp.]|nr:acyltransferase [Bacteroides sp.]MCM1096121.1 acyltransferase [Terasakiella sp.]